MSWSKDLKQCDESLKVRWDIVPFTRGRGIDAGCGATKLFPHFIGIDNKKDVKLFNLPVNADIVSEVSEMPFFADSSMDFVFSSHTLEHIKDHEKTLKEWWRLIKPGGYLVLYLPHADFYPKMGEADSNPDHVHDFLPDDIIKVMGFAQWDLVVNEERNEGEEYSFLQVYEKKTVIGPIQHLESWKNPKPKKTCAIVRYGAWGDGIQASSILPGLKNQGFHITLYATPRCFEVLKHEPLIDKVILQDTDQVPNGWLGEYWAHLKKKYDKFINLSESVETQFLVTPDRVAYNWPLEARHAQMNNNYGEILHKIAAVPYMGPESRFVATEAEKTWAKSEIEDFGFPTILWILSGSAIHKVYPHIDEVIEIFSKEYPIGKIMTVGDAKCRDILEKPWLNNPRIVCRSGAWDIRQTMSIAQQCDLVIGPETGVMNSVAMDDVGKIVLLSHSSVENLTRDWVNTTSLFSKNTPCAPCHKMIYTWDQCNRDDETGTARCMSDITAEEVCGAIRRGLSKSVSLVNTFVKAA